MPRNTQSQGTFRVKGSRSAIGTGEIVILEDSHGYTRSQQQAKEDGTKSKIDRVLRLAAQSAADTASETLDGLIADSDLVLVNGVLPGKEIRRHLMTAWITGRHIHHAMSLEPSVKPSEVGHPWNPRVADAVKARRAVIERVLKFVLDDLESRGYRVVASHTDSMSGKTFRPAVLPNR